MFGRLALGDDFEIGLGRRRRCRATEPGTRRKSTADRRPGGVGSARLADGEHADVLLGRRRSRRASSAMSGAITISVAEPVMASAAALSICPFAATMPPKADTGSQAKRLVIGVRRDRRRCAMPQGLACLMMAMAGVFAVEGGDEIERGFGIAEIVVGHLFALVLRRADKSACGAPGPCRRRPSDAGSRRRADLPTLRAERLSDLGEHLALHAEGEPGRDRRVILGGAGIGLGGELAPQLDRRLAVVLFNSSITAA